MFEPITKPTATPTAKAKSPAATPAAPARPHLTTPTARQIPTPTRRSTTAPAAEARAPLRPTTKEPGYVLDKDTGTPRWISSTTQIKQAKAWYQANAQQYTPQVIKQIQKKLDLPVTGTVDHAFLNSVTTWQTNFDLPLASGRGTKLPNGNELMSFGANGVLVPEQLAKMFPTGLGRVESMTRYVKDTEKIVQTWGTLDTAGKRANAIKTLLTQYSRANGIPIPSFQSVQMTPGLNGSFTHRTWKLEINSAALNANMTPDQIRDTMATLYHEARHAEQNFMVLRLLAGTGRSAAEIRSETSLPTPVIASAMRQPIQPGSVQAVVANEFYQARFGATAEARDKTMYNLTVRRLEMRAAQDELHYLNTQRTQVVQKLKAATSPEAKTERQQQLQKLDAQLRTARAREATSIKNYNAVYEDYRALPGERDAWDTNGAMRVIRARTGSK